MSIYNNKKQIRNIKHYLYVDDIREPNIQQDNINLNVVFIARTYKDAIKELNTHKYDIIDLDHDLGEDKTGYDICKYIIENKIKCDIIRIHTSNPVGRDNMVQLLSRYYTGLIEIM